MADPDVVVIDPNTPDAKAKLQKLVDFLRTLTGDSPGEALIFCKLAALFLEENFDLDTETMPTVTEGHRRTH